MKRIHIIGGPGSGKTWLAIRLSKKYNIPHYDLDTLWWDKEDTDYSKRAPEEERVKKLQSIVKKDAWLIEGIYYEWLQPSFDKADCIIILKTNVFLRDFRIITRFIKSKFMKMKKQRVKETLRLLKWNHRFDKEQLIPAEKLMDKKKVHHFKTKAGIKRFLTKTISDNS